MAVAGVPERLRRIGSPTRMDIGNGRMRAGTGSVINRGAGRVSTTGRGTTLRSKVGCGFRARNGPPRGLPGATAMITLAGRPVDRAARSWELRFSRSLMSTVSGTIFTIDAISL